MAQPLKKVEKAEYLAQPFLKVEDLAQPFLKVDLAQPFLKVGLAQPFLKVEKVDSTKIHKIHPIVKLCCFIVL